MQDIPPKVTINEAVEISKKNGAEEAWEFVNGILDRIKQDMDPRTQDRRSTCSSVSSTSPRAALPRG